MKTNEARTGDGTVNQVAEYLSLHPETVRIMARSGDFPNAYKAGAGRPSSPLRIPWADVDNYRALQPKAHG